MRWIDARFATNPLVTSAPDIRFYAGAPLITPGGHAIGTLCVIDRVPRDLTAAQRDALTALSRQVVAQLELHCHVARLETLATTDALTDLKNVRAFRENLQTCFADSRRYQTPLSLVTLDADNFKAYNDSYGHPAGDEVLKQIARVLQENSRASDVAARCGGEEFAVMLPNTGREEALRIAERIRGAIARAEWPGRAMTASLGVTTRHDLMRNEAAFLAAADRALYASKRLGKDRVTHSVAVADETDANHKDNPSMETSASVSAQLEASYDLTLKGWSRLMDLRDKETEGHSERVTELSGRLAKRVGFDAQALVYLRWGGLLHDIGKIGIPDCVLLKPGPLTEAEWEVMRRHPTYAYEMLEPIEFLRPSLDIPLYHHEKWDGSGYPRGLKGEEIPLAARIFAIVDVWDALRSDRPYRAAWPEAKTLSYLREQSGLHFDPVILEEFLAMVTEEAAESKPLRKAA